MKEIGVGIIGYGFIGKAHAYAYRTVPFHYDPPPAATRLVGVATSRPETAEAARRHGGFEVGTDDWRALLDRRDISVINICSPNAAHVDQVLAAIAAGKSVYCDKPLSVTAEEAARVEAALPGWTGIGQMTLHNRFYAATLRARQLVEEGFLGEVIGLRGVYLHSGSVDPEAPLSWKLRAGGGALLDLGSHLMDLVDWLAGPLAAVRAETRILYPTRPDGRGGRAAVDAEDQVVMTVRTVGGALGTLEVSKIATGADDDLRVEIHGTRGALRFALADADVLEIHDRGARDRPLGGTRGWTRVSTAQRYGAPAAFPSPRAASGWLRGHVHCLWNFLDGVARGVPVEPSLARGAAVQRMMAAAQRSAVTGSFEPVTP
jgi:predicted dehydrogenase